MNSGYVKFVGDYSKLKSLGFTFQKLFAGNYMQWEKDGIRVWKRGSDVTYDSINLYKLLNLLEGDNKKKQKLHNHFVHLIKQYYEDQDGYRTYDILSWDDGRDDMIEYNKTYEDDFDGDLESIKETYSDVINLIDLLPIYKLIEKGWIEMVPYQRADNGRCW